MTIGFIKSVTERELMPQNHVTELSQDFQFERLDDGTVGLRTEYPKL